jgi:hypothetical protein
MLLIAGVYLSGVVLGALIALFVVWLVITN